MAIIIGENATTVKTYPTTIGSDSEANGDNCVAVGAGARSHGSTCLVVGSSTEITGQFTSAINAGRSLIVNGRITDYSTYLGYSAYAAVSQVCKLSGTDYLPMEFGAWTAANTAAETRSLQVTERIFSSPPVCPGEDAWVASTSYKIGQCVTPTTGNVGYSYYATDSAKVFGQVGNYASSLTSGSGEPTWGTTDGGKTIDNGIGWVCVDLSNIRATIPDYLRFIPSQVGFLCDEHAASATTEPTISWGIQADKDKWLIATALSSSLMSGAYAGQWIDVTNSEGAKDLTAEVTIEGDGATSGRVVWKGVCIETMTA